MKSTSTQRACRHHPQAVFSATRVAATCAVALVLLVIGQAAAGTQTKRVTRAGRSSTAPTRRVESRPKGAVASQPAARRIGGTPQAPPGFRYRKFSSGNPQRRQIAITFDDGPHRESTPAILAILKKHNAKATFFVVGEKAEQFPDLVKAEAEAGHAVGNHTYNHLSLKRIPDEYIPLEIEVCGSIIKRITGSMPRLFRPPGGGYDVQITEYAESLGYTTVLWTINSGDYACPPEEVIWDRVAPHVRNGSIILFHDGVPETIRMLPKLLARLKARGFEMVTVEELMRWK